jgi:lipooligosaccharide transport system permease protein
MHYLILACTALCSGRFVSVYRRNLLVWRKLATASLLGNVADPLITLMAFGYGIGQWIREIDTVPYIVFLSAGSICMSTMMAASFESLYSAFSRMQAQRTWESIMNAPLEFCWWGFPIRLNFCWCCRWWD